MRYVTDGERATVTIENYADLLAIRAVPEYRFVGEITVEFDAAHLGVLGVSGGHTAEYGDLAPHLFDYQEWVTALALDRQRFAVFADTGLGKTAIQLEWARVISDSTGGRVLIVAPLNVCAQSIAEADHFYGPALEVCDLTKSGDLDSWLRNAAPGVAITNYEKLDGCTEALPVTGLVLDESSILKHSMGARRTALIAAGRGLRYKLCCSATPAPNDRTEYAEHAYFLDVVRSPREFLAAYFVNRDGEWQLKRHGQTAFYRHLASWSVFMRDPKSYGFSDHLADMPPLDVQFPRIDLTPEQIAISQEYQKGDQLSLLGAQAGGIVSRTKLMQIAHGFLLDAE